MKFLTLLAVIMAFTFTACNSSKTKETQVVEKAKSTEKMYACSMHPEVTGKEGDTCSKCSMALTEVKQTVDSTKMK
ncbi:MAG: heavy metal-binding domain-containing protein [Bacteroidota bacterium]|jgi:hypothetical protein